MPEAMIKFFGKTAKVNCDGQCQKAWGINNRPRIMLSDNENDYAYLPDHELMEAPSDPATYEGGCAKPNDSSEFPTKWCVRECERCAMSKPYEYEKPLAIKRFDDLVYNIPRTDNENMSGGL